MTYQLVFEVSDRSTDIALGIVCAVVLIALTGLVVASGLRRVVLRGAAGVVVLAFLLSSLSVLRSGGEVGRSFMLGSVLPIALLAVGSAFDVKIRWLPSISIDVRSLAVFVGILLLLFPISAAVTFSSAQHFAVRLRAGEGRIVAGIVHDTKSYNWAHECFYVSTEQFCITDGGPGPGYHQSVENGGVIRDGAEIRMVLIDDQIVRLEVAK